MADKNKIASLDFTYFKWYNLRQYGTTFGRCRVEITIRRVRPDEMGLLCELDVKIFGDEDAFNTPDLWEGLEAFFVVVNGLIVGSTALRHNTDVAESYEADYAELHGSLYIVSTGIVPEWQGQGIGSKVKEWQVDYAQAHRFARIVTNARTSNTRSIKLNQKLGFQIIQSIPGWYGDESTVVLERKL